VAARLIVIDTDVLVSTAGHPDKTIAIWEAVRTGRLVPVTTESALRELLEVTGRPKVQTAIPKLQANLPLFLAEYRRYTRVVAEPPPRFALQADPKDSFLFDIASQAQAIVSFDSTHVLPLADPAHPQHSELKSLAPTLKILHPGEMARMLLLEQPGSP
jgi:putative PIN family toxin of toxin-antitoxin system